MASTADVTWVCIHYMGYVTWPKGAVGLGTGYAYAVMELRGAQNVQQRELLYRLIVR